MELRKITRDIIQQVEEISGFPVQVTQDGKLQNIATVRIARGNNPFHFVIYKPNAGEPPDYAICHQSCFIIRKFSVPQSDRFDIASSEAGTIQVEKLLNTPTGVAFRYGLKKESVQQLRDQLLQGLIVHLLSVPTGLRVSAWLEENYPELSDLQRKHVDKELAIGKVNFEDNIKGLFPPQIYKATMSISAAYALYWSQKYNDPKIFAPYRFDYRKSADELLSVQQAISSDPAHDRELVDAWGEILGLTSWYRWVPYQLPA